jgi:SdrD B-like domain/Bacterial Ig domain/Calx-beta domain
VLNSVTTPEDMAVGITLNATDIDGDGLVFGIVSGPSHGTLSGTGANRTYTPHANYNGPDSFSFSATDGSLSSSATVSITVTSVNDAPCGTSNAVTLPFSGSYTFSGSDFGFTDPYDAPGNSFAGVTIATLPSAGTLRLSGTAVSAGQHIAVANISNLVFVADGDAGEVPYTTFTFQVRDDGGVSNGGVDLDPSPKTFTINFNSVVSVIAVDPDASESGDPGLFSVTRTGSNAEDLTVSYLISGTADNGADYETISGSVVIPAGVDSALIEITPLLDKLTEGDETVTLTLQSGGGYYVIVADAVSVHEALPDGEVVGYSSDTVTIHDADAVTVGDYVWVDTNRDGVQDEEEVGKEGVHVELESATGDVLAEATTDDEGGYELVADRASIVPGDTYYVHFTLPDGYRFTAQDEESDPTADSDADAEGYAEVVFSSSQENISDIDAGLVEVFTVGDYVWVDANEDGIQDGEENGQHGIHVQLQDDEGTILSEDTTNDYGYYELIVDRSDVTSGSPYYVYFEVPFGTSFTTQHAGGDATLDSDPDQNGYAEIIFSSSPDAYAHPDVDAGLIEALRIGDYVWVDANEDGIQDLGEDGQAGVLVTLQSAAGDILASDITDTNGYYTLAVSRPDIVEWDTYYVHFELPSGYRFTGQYLGDATADSDSDIAGFAEVTFTSDLDEASYTDIDAGLVETVTIGDYVWVDDDGDGIQSLDEYGMPGVAVALENDVGDILAEAYTDLNGRYELTVDRSQIVWAIPTMSASSSRWAMALLTPIRDSMTTKTAMRTPRRDMRRLL